MLDGLYMFASESAPWDKWKLIREDLVEANSLFFGVLELIDPLKVCLAVWWNWTNCVHLYYVDTRVVIIYHRQQR